MRKPISKLSLFLILALMLSFLVACGGETATEAPTEEPAAEAPVEEPTEAPAEEPAAEPTEAPAEEPAAEEPAAEVSLTVWADELRAPIMQGLAADFEAEYGIALEVQQIGFGDIRDQFKVAAPAGEGPDILVGAHDWLGELVINGLVEPMDLAGKESDFTPEAIQAFTYEGELYGMPTQAENVAFVYNPELVPEAPTTWAEVVEIATALQEAGTVEQGFVMQQGDPYHFFPIQTAFGGYVFGLNDDGTYNPNDVGIDSPGSLAAAQWLDEQVQNGILTPDVEWDVMHSMFENGESAMFITGPWALDRIRESGIPYAIAPIPAGTEAGKPFIGVQGFMVSAFSDDPLLAQTFLTEFVATEETLLRMFEGNPRPPAYIPALEQIDDEDIAAFSVASEGGLPMPAIPEMSGVWSAWGDAVTLIFQGSSEGTEAFQNAAAQIREGIGAPEPTPVPEGADAGSDQAAGSSAEVSLTVWADEVRAPIMEELAADFEAEYGIGLDVQQLAFGDVRDQFKVAAPAGEGPDIIIGAHDWLGELVVNGLVEPMDLAGKDDQFVDPALQAFSYEGQLYGMPYLTENVAFFYNPELVPEAPATWDEVMEIAQSLEEAGTVEQGYVLHQGDAYHFFPIQTSFGGYVFGQNADGSYNAGEVGIDSEGSVAAAEWLEARIAEGTLVADMEWDAMHSMFENGESAMFITGPWALERIRESGVSYAIAPIPAGTEEGRPFLGVQGFMVSAFSEDPLLAQTFLTEFVATEETMQKMFEADPRGPAFIPVLETVEDEDIVAFAEAGANALPMPAIPEMSSVWSAWGDAITLIFQGSDSGDTAFQNAAEQIRSAIQEGQ